MLGLHTPGVVLGNFGFYARFSEISELNAVAYPGGFLVVWNPPGHVFFSNQVGDTYWHRPSPAASICDFWKPPEINSGYATAMYALSPIRVNYVTLSKG